jgi:NAD(P)H-dependent FMN reductase
MDKIKIKIILGSIREGRFGERPANWINEELKNWEGVDAELLDLKDYPMPFFDAPMGPSMMNMKYPNETVQKWSDKIKEADAFIVVSPEYNHGYSSVLKNALDWLGPEWSMKPAGFVSYGSVSGARAIEQLRTVAIELNMVPIKKSIHIGWEFMMSAWNNKSISNADLFAPLRKGTGPMGSDHLAAFMENLLWMARALKSARQSA